MNSPTIIASVQCCCSEALRRVVGALTRRGLRALETFDLQDARTANADCACPHHGTAQCDCQMIVLLVYGEATAPTTLTLHGNDGQTLISLSDDPGRGPHPLIQAAVEEAIRDTGAGEGL